LMVAVPAPTTAAGDDHDDRDDRDHRDDTVLNRVPALNRVSVRIGSNQPYGLHDPLNVSRRLDER
jgi:hypothetical protein